ncbi:porin [Actimicrobium sp. CCC2.4]|uniref:porin n=1 Tax=Actimicrobium sp. CCC2.4 TaxID=3048606 RepID=UPI002AC97DAE|nr:porin [Actimicrobium sp. CCC2.4]MEB0136371.1 porin [Actimicrobium sp. CCC2.4]WPX31190.1 porin [Actimicrobium sp. CCC2.4]
MKKSLLALAILGTIAGSAAAQSSVTVYGVVDMGISRDDNGATTTTALNSGIQSGSRLGFKGVEDLGNGLKALFVLETGINADTGGFAQSNTAFGRQSYLGLQGNFGTVKLGRQTTLLYNTLSAIDPFAIGLAGDATRFFNPAGNRMNNTIAYESPNVSGFKGAVQYGFGEVAGNNSASRQITGMLQYANGPVLVALTHHNAKNALDTASDKTTLLAGTYDFSVVKAHVAYDQRKVDNSTVDIRDMMVGVSVPFGASTFLVDYTKRKNKFVSNADADQVALGYTYALSKRTNLYTSYSRLSNDGASNVGGFAAANGETDNLFNVGVRHTF